jgi:hypothetical protein
MLKQIALVSVVGFVGLIAAASAQAAPSSTGGEEPRPPGPISYARSVHRQKAV